MSGADLGVAMPRSANAIRSSPRAQAVLVEPRTNWSCATSSRLIRGRARF